MIKEIEFKDMNDRLGEDPSAKFYLIMRPIPDYINFSQIQECPVLASSAGLAHNYRLGLIPVREFQKKYFNEMKSPICEELIRSIIKKAKWDNI